MSEEDSCSDFFTPYSNMGTSKEAAESIKDIAGELRRTVYRYIVSKQEYGATDEEIALGLSLDSNTARPRRWELAREGRIRRNGIRRTRSGRNAEVWVAHGRDKDDKGIVD